MPNAGGSYVMRNGKPELVHRTKPAPTYTKVPDPKPAATPAKTETAAPKPAKAAKKEVEGNE